MSDRLFEVRLSPELGRHLVASSAISPGQLVVQQEPFCAVLYDEQVPLRCDFCFRAAAPGEALHRCSRSRHARYCSREHQMEAWAAGYQQECQALVAHAPRVPPATVRLAARALWRHLRQQGSVGDEAEHGSWRAVQALLSHWTSVEDERKITYAQMAVLTREFAARGLAAAAAEALPSVQEVAHLLARFACNNHTICDEELRPLGVGLYPLGALLNHSCRPNCMQSFGPRGRIEFRSLVHIQAGEPLTISYVELAATRQERREELAACYFFDTEPLPPPTAPLPSHTAAEEAAASSMSGQHQGAAAAAASSTSSPGASAAPPGAAEPPPPFSRSCLRPSAPAAEILFHLEGWPDGLQTPAVAPAEGAQQAEGSQLPGVLRVYRSIEGPKQAPPWPCDERDALLTQLVLLQQPESASAASGRLLEGALPLPGGVQVHLVSKQAGAFDGGREEPMNLEEGDEGGEEQGAGEGRFSGRDAAATHGGQVVEVDCWGDWALRSLAAAAGKLDGSGLGSIAEDEGEACPSSSAAAAAVPVGALARRLGAAAHLLAQAELVGSKSKQGEAVQLLQRALGLVDPGISCDDAAAGAGGRAAPPVSQALPGLGQFHLLRMRLNAALLKAAIENGNSWEVALQAARDLMPVYQLVYPATWPNLGLHHATLAKLELLLDHPQRAHVHARSALSILEVTHSKSGGLGFGGQGVLSQVEDCLSQASASLRAPSMS